MQFGSFMKHYGAF